jgi:hypothetical protein
MLMSPKSRLYTLVKAWKNTNPPFHEVRDACGDPGLALVAKLSKNTNLGPSDERLAMNPFLTAREQN